MILHLYLLEFQVWGSYIATPRTPYSYQWFPQPQMVQTPGINTPSSTSQMDEKHLAIQAALELEELGDDRFDPATESGAPPPRPFLLLHASVIGVSMALIVFVEMLCVSKVIAIIDSGKNRSAKQFDSF